MNRADYLAALREELKGRYPWANDAAKVARYMGRVEEGIAPDAKGGAGFEYDGPAAAAAWQAIGGKGKPKLADLRGLE